MTILLLATVLFVFPYNSDSSSDIPYDNLAYPVLLVSTGGTETTTGSGFFYNRHDATYFVTARHVLFDETSVELIEQFPLPHLLIHKAEWKQDDPKMKWILVFYGVMSAKEKDELLSVAPRSVASKEAIQRLYRESQKLRLRRAAATLYSYSPKPSDSGLNQIQLELPKLYQAGQIMYHPSSDVALIRIATPKKIGEQNLLTPIDGVTMTGPGILGLGKDTVKLFDDVLVGNTVYAFGYPTSISQLNPFMGVKFPLLRKGALAGKNNSLKTIILDCPIYYGNSGGLVIEAERIGFNTRFSAIGLVTNLVPYAGKWLQNSGYSIAVPMDFVEELLKATSKN